MKQISSVLVLVLFIFSNSYGQNATVESIRATFNGYRTAIIEEQAKEALKYVDKNTIRYYETILNHVNKSDSATVDALGLLDKIMIFSIRSRTPREEILSFDAKKLFIYAIEKGMIGKNTIDALDIGNISVEGKSAKGQITQQGHESPYFFNFYKEKKHWKIDLTSIFADTEEPMEMMLEQEGLDSNEYALLLLEMVTGKIPTSVVWKPVKP